MVKGLEEKCICTDLCCVVCASVSGVCIYIYTEIRAADGSCVDLIG